MHTLKTISIAALAASAASASVTVSDVAFTQDDATHDVTITYNLATSDGEPAFVSLDVLTNGIPLPVAAVQSVSGDISTTLTDFVADGVGKQIVWKARTDWKGNLTSNATIVVSAHYPNHLEGVYLRIDVTPGIRVEGLTLENAPYWSCFFHGCNAVRLGVGNGEVRDASLRNLVIRGTRTAVSAVGSWKRGERGCDIRHVVFEDLDIESRNFCHIYYKFATGSVFEDIAFRRVRGKVSGASVIEDTPERPFRNLVFERIMLAGETSPIASGQQHEVGKPPSPAALP